VYDGTLTPPATIPTKTGYTFKGWKLRVFDLTTLDTSINGSRYGYKDVPPYSKSSLTEYFGLTEDLTWAAEFSYGMVYGEASCNTTNGTYSAVVNWGTNTFEYTILPQNIKSADTFEKSITGGRCWCRVTNVVPTEKLSRKATPTPWVFFTGSSWDISTCSHYCPTYCGFATKEIAEFRQAIYGQAN
jgi:hypothetical protein